MREDSSHFQNALVGVQAAWNAAASPWNPQSLAQVYSGDALFFGGRPGHAVGSEEILGYFKSYHQVIKSAALELVDQHVAPLGPSHFLAQGYGRFSFVLADDVATTTVLRTTLVLVLAQTTWKICGHHFSVSPDAPPLGRS